MKQGWEIKKLGEVCETSSGGTPSKTHKEYYEGGNIPWLRSGEVSQGLIYDTELYITTEGLDNSSAKIFPIDTVVIAMYGATVGQVGILKNAMSTNQAVCGIFPTPKFTPLFLVYYFKAKKSYFLSLAAGGAQPNISQQIIRDTYIPVPPIAEQEKIVEELDCLSGIIEKKKLQLKELDALAESIFYTMFGDPITNEKGWEIKKWKDMITIVNGKNQKAVENPNGLYPIYGSGGVMGYADKFLCPNDTIVIGRKGNINKPIFVREQFWNVDTAFGLVSNKVDLDAHYLFYYCRIFDFEQLNKAVTIPSLTKSDLLELNTPCPPLTIQQEFANKIEAIEKQKELIKQSIKETEELFNSRMDYYFN